MLGFRVWDNAYLKFMETQDFFINENGRIIQTSSFIGKWHVPDINRFILMQSTGISDCKDRMIFEGDIVVCQKNMTDYVVKVESVTDFLIEWGQDCDGDRVEMYINGNIYEDEHLLQDVKSNEQINK